jgi:ornithine carbamoyltransferase
MMKRTAKGKALYMHCLPADITGVSCKQGEVSANVFEKYRIETYKEAGWKPYIIAAMIMARRFADPAQVLAQVLADSRPRVR